MRLSDFQIISIKKAVKNHFGEESKLYLFGSRVDDSKRGGDIDLLVISSLGGEKRQMAKLKTMSQIQRYIGDQKIDIVPVTQEEYENSENLIIQEAKKKSVCL